jgi:hypothetical protein
MPTRPLNVDSARKRIRQIDDPVLRVTVEEALAAALKRWELPETTADSAWNHKLPVADFDLLFFVEVLTARKAAAPQTEPWRTTAQELFGAVPLEGFGDGDQSLEELPLEEELGQPEELEFPEDVLRPIEEEPAGSDDLGLALVTQSEGDDPFACFDGEESYDD